jgi:hypothetical protein
MATAARAAMADSAERLAVSSRGAKVPLACLIISCCFPAVCSWPACEGTGKHSQLVEGWVPGRRWRSQQDMAARCAR